MSSNNQNSNQGNYSLAQRIMKDNVFKTMIDTNEIYVYKNGVYKKGGDQLIRKIAQTYMKARATNHKINEIIGIIQRTMFTERKKFDTNPFLLNVKNGLYDLKDNSFSTHNPSILSTTQLPINYNKDSECIKIKEFFTQVLNPEDIPAIEELIGYCLLKDYPIQKAGLFFGSGSNGKSVVLRLITSLLGEENVSHISLQDLDKSKFLSAELKGKLANICADLSNESLFNTEVFKSLTGQDYIKAEHKFGHPFSFKNHAKLIFSTNDLPETKDKSYAFYRRLHIFLFPNRFEGTSDNPYLLEELTINKELEGLLNLAILGLKRLLKIGDFSNSLSIEQTKKIYESHSSSVSGFIRECIVENPEGKLTKEEAYCEYLAYCSKYNISPLANNAFGRKFKECFPNITDRRIGTKNAWAGVSLNISDIQDIFN